MSEWGRPRRARLTSGATSLVAVVLACGAISIGLLTDVGAAAPRSPSAASSSGLTTRLAPPGTGSSVRSLASAPMPAGHLPVSAGIGGPPVGVCSSSPGHDGVAGTADDDYVAGSPTPASSDIASSDVGASGGGNACWSSSEPPVPVPVNQQSSPPVPAAVGPADVAVAQVADDGVPLLQIERNSAVLRRVPTLTADAAVRSGQSDSAVVPSLIVIAVGLVLTAMVMFGSPISRLRRLIWR
ncbi:MAG: hypothetical protein JWM34_3142 [Ilumatobacteraceae bacterium]|nr:hypothetical protein [Ilumatobacteraceae bacterium]